MTKITPKHVAFAAIAAGLYGLFLYGSFSSDPVIEYFWQGRNHPLFPPDGDLLPQMSVFEFLAYMVFPAFGFYACVNYLFAGFRRLAGAAAAPKVWLLSAACADLLARLYYFADISQSVFDTRGEFLLHRAVFVVPFGLSGLFSLGLILWLSDREGL